MPRQPRLALKERGHYVCAEHLAAAAWTESISRDDVRMYRRKVAEECGEEGGSWKKGKVAGAHTAHVLNLDKCRL